MNECDEDQIEMLAQGIGIMLGLVEGFCSDGSITETEREQLVERGGAVAIRAIKCVRGNRTDGSPFTFSDARLVLIRVMRECLDRLDKVQP